MKSTFGTNHTHPVLSLAIALAALIGSTIGVSNASAGTIAVTTLVDTGPDAPAPGSLRAALASAVDGDTIDTKGLTGTITLMSGSLSSELVIDKSLTIAGPGATVLTVDGNHAGRVFHITPGHTVTVDGLKITNGFVDAIPPENYGGGIYNDHSILSIENCVISNNSALGDVNTGGGQGGGIFNNGGHSGGAMLTIAYSVVSGNAAEGEAGAIANIASGTGSATLVVDHSTISGNTASIDAAIENFGGTGATATAAIIASTISGNTARFEGGAIGNNGRATLDLSISTVTGNSVSNQYGNGAGIVNTNGGVVRINSCTFSGNSLSGPTGLGGAIYNTGSSLEIGNSILRAGSIGDNLYEVPSVINAHIVSKGFNLSSDAAGGDGTTGPGGFLNTIGDVRNTDPVLGPLADNGGPTLTHLPLPGSPAIDQGSSAGLVPFGITTDQRDLLRTVDNPAIANAAVGDGTDIGAVELQAALPPPPPNPVADLAVTFLGADKLSVKQGEVITYTISVRNFGPDTARNVVVTDLLSSGTGFLSARATKGTFAAPTVNQTGTVVWNLSDMTNGSAEGAELVVSVLVKGKTTITNLVTIKSDAEDPDPKNNLSSITIAVAAGGSDTSGGKKK